jgi:ubiquinone/menaquinone biosynthesis C-methylase UbiE
MKSSEHNTSTSEFFSSWAASGKGHSMAKGHSLLVAGLFERLDLKGKSVLDVGCGIGEALLEAKARGASSCAGIDLSNEMIEIARKRLPEADFQTGSVEKLPWQTNSFDLSISIEAMYYFHNPEESLKEIYRVLKPGGLFASAIEFYKENAGSQVWAEQLPMKIWCWSEQEWQQAFEEAGFSEVSCARIVRKTVKSKSEFQASDFFPDYDSYLAYVREGALVVSGKKV